MCSCLVVWIFHALTKTASGISHLSRISRRILSLEVVIKSEVCSRMTSITSIRFYSTQKSVAVSLKFTQKANTL